MKGFMMIKGKLALFCLAAAISNQAAQANVLCTFNVKAVSIDSWGSLLLELDQAGTPFNWWFCNMGVGVAANNGYGDLTVSPQMCQALYAQFASARMGSRPVALEFNGPASCASSALPTAGFPAPYPTRFAL